MKLPHFCAPESLAPGDSRALQGDWSALELHNIGGVADPCFDLAYRYLWDEFGASHEIEQRDVLARRFRWDIDTTRDGCRLEYQMLLFTVHGQFAAARDHTLIVPDDENIEAIVHLSHVLIHPLWRRTGLGGWTRALPLTFARECLAKLDQSDRPITLLAEMEPPAGGPGAMPRMVRLSAYEKAGFLKPDPALINYLQPDFRPTETIDASGGPEPLPFHLVMRRVGRDTETEITGRELREMVQTLYTMYAAEFRSQDMGPCYASLKDYPCDNERVPLLPPTH
jgi:GNAT superfamily N-acetyltransferase